jgi:uncharacterized membrane protein
MLKGLMHEIALAVRSRSGVTPALFVWIAVVTLAALTAFVFLCVAGYDWFTVQFGNVFAALIMTGIFVLIAAIGIVICVLARRQARERAILERAARARTPSWFLDPRVLTAGIQAGRAFGWQRIVPIVLLGFMAAQWAREHREPGHQDSADSFR